jgi:cell division protein FtsI/penicillin-binding protein 2
MGEVMTEGTGKKSQSDLYTLFGKSGTAQLPKADGSGYFEDRYTASFIAGAPLDNPTVVVICVIDDPDRKIAHYGGEVAGPVVRDIIDDTLEYLGVPPTKLQVANKH